jgi:hypothetical protein
MAFFPGPGMYLFRHGEEGLRIHFFCFFPSPVADNRRSFPGPGTYVLRQKATGFSDRSTSLRPTGENRKRENKAGKS